MWLKTAIQASNDFSIIWLNRQFQDLRQVLKMFFRQSQVRNLWWLKPVRKATETQLSRLSLAQLLPHLNPERSDSSVSPPGSSRIWNPLIKELWPNKRHENVVNQKQNPNRTQKGWFSLGLVKGYRSSDLVDRRMFIWCTGLTSIGGSCRIPSITSWTCSRHANWDVNYWHTYPNWRARFPCWDSCIPMIKCPSYIIGFLIFHP